MPWWGAGREERSARGEVTEEHMSGGEGGQTGTEPERKEEARAKGTGGRGDTRPMCGARVGRAV